MLHNKTISLLLGLLMGSLLLTTLLAGSLFVAKYNTATTSEIIRQVYPTLNHGEG